MATTQTQKCRKSDGEVRAKGDVAPVRIPNPGAKNIKGNGEPPKRTDIRRRDNFVK